MIPSPEEIELLGEELRETFPGGVVPLGWALGFARERGIEVLWVTAARKAVGLELAMPVRPERATTERLHRLLERDYPEHEVPVGTWTALAPQLGVTVQRVQ